jgi:hypothetical protein
MIPAFFSSARMILFECHESPALKGGCSQGYETWEVNPWKLGATQKTYLVVLKNELVPTITHLCNIISIIVDALFCIFW